MKRRMRMLAGIITRRRSSLFRAAAGGVGVLAALPALLTAFASDHVVQDDARQHVFWMARFVDPALFPNDPIADYFESIAPLGYRYLYWAATLFGIDPHTLAKLIPLFLSVLCAVLLFDVIRLGAKYLPSHGALLLSFFGSWIFVTNLWLTDALSNATPRAFSYPLLLGFLQGILRGSMLGVSLFAALLAVFYPAMAVLALAVSALMFMVDVISAWNTGIPRRSFLTRHQRVLLVSLVAGGLALAPFAVHSSTFGSVITRAEAQLEPAFQTGGRSAFFFEENASQFWLCGARSGFLPIEWCKARETIAPSLPPIFSFLGWGLVAGISLLLLPSGTGVRVPGPRGCGTRARARALEPRRSGGRVGALELWLTVFVASLALYIVAHLVLFRLHLPGRYTQHSLRILSAMSIAALFIPLLSRMGSAARIASISTGLMVTGLMVTLLGAPRVAWYGYVQGEHDALYSYLKTRPKGLMIASIDAEACNIPSFAMRSVLVSREHSIPYHRRFHEMMKDRTRSTIEALYTSDPRVLEAFIVRWNVTHFLIHDQTWDPSYLEDKTWLRSFPLEIERAATSLKLGTIPLLSRAAPLCDRVRDRDLRLIDAYCVLRTSKGILR